MHVCECGCGKQTTIAKRDYNSRGVKAGQHYRFIKGHNNIPKGPEYLEEDRGFSSPCWIWQHARAKAGYGLTRDEDKKTVTAHRVYYQRVVGPIPPKLQLDHLCRVRECVNPAHLEAVTNAENTRRGWMTRLNREKVERIKLLAASGVRFVEISKIYDVSANHIGSIVHGEKWVAV
jgi:hypothetical protein